MEEIKGSFVDVSFKQSSSKDGKVGLDVTVKCTENVQKEEITRLANMALETALKTFGTGKTQAGI